MQPIHGDGGTAGDGLSDDHMPAGLEPHSLRCSLLSMRAARVLAHTACNAATAPAPGSVFVMRSLATH